MKFDVYNNVNKMYRTIMKVHHNEKKEFISKARILKGMNKKKLLKVVEKPEPSKSVIKLVNKVVSTFPENDRAKLARNRSHTHYNKTGDEQIEVTKSSQNSVRNV